MEHLRGELKKVFKIEEVDKLNNQKINTAKFHDEANLHTLKIYADSEFFKRELSKFNWIEGDSRVEIIIDNQLLKLPGKFNITSEMINQMKNMSGVKKIDFIE